MWRKVIGFSRHARKHPRRDLGAPPGARRRDRRGLIGRMGLAVAAAVFVPPVADAGLGALTPGEGCRVVGVVDGVTVRGWCADRFGRMRRVGVDTPESAARCPSAFPGAMRATWVLRLALWRAGRVDVTGSARGDWCAAEGPT